MLEQFSIQEILPRTHNLIDKYLHKAHRFNPLIRDLIEEYKTAPDLDAGLLCRGKPGPTPLGLFKRHNHAEFIVNN